MENTEANLTPPYRFLHPHTKADVLSKETVVLQGNEQDPEVQQTKKRIEEAGRKVEVEQRPTQDSGLGICGQHMCHCTEPCKSFHYNPKAQ